MNVRAKIALLVVVMVVLPAFVQAQQGDEYTLRIYDLRDLDAAFAGGAVSGALSTAGHMFGGRGGVAVGRGAAPEPTTSGSILARIAGPTALAEYEELAPGIFMIGADSQGHETLMRLLTDLRALFSERYVVDIVSYTVEQDDAPRVGSAAECATPGARHQLVVVRRRATSVTSVRAEHYLANLDPRLAEGVFAYSAQVREVVAGLQLTVTVGAGPQDADATSVEAHGRISHIEFDRATGPEGGGSGAAWRVELPTISERTIDAQTQVPFDQPTVISVVPGFNDGEVLVVAVTVSHAAE